MIGSRVGVVLSGRPIVEGQWIVACRPRACVVHARLSIDGEEIWRDDDRR